VDDGRTRGRDGLHAGLPELARGLPRLASHASLQRQQSRCRDCHR
jgi:hypothetical protein